MKNILYISLSGMTEALGRSQVFEYLIDLSKTNKIYLISFERQNDKNNLSMIQDLAKYHNIEWTYFNYTNKFGIFSTIIQIAQAVIYASKVIKKNKVDIIHSRSMIPATMAIILRKIHKIKHLFDIRGFVFDEKVDSGRLKKNTLMYKILLKLENTLYLNSDYIVTLTKKSKEIISLKYKIKEVNISVIPTCANKEIFKCMNKEDTLAFKLNEGFHLDDVILIHSGAVTNSYDFDSEVKVFEKVNKLDNRIKFMVVNQGQHEYIKKVFLKYHIPENNYKIKTSTFENMHKYLNISNASIFFIPPTYSKQASTPTKFAENLLCHLPSITNLGVGDMDYYMMNYNVGSIFDLNDCKNDINNVVSEIMKVLLFNNTYDFDILFHKYFDKVNAVNDYDKIYAKLNK